MPSNTNETEETQHAVLSVSECANLLKISRGSAYKACFSGEIVHIKIGRRILIPRQAIEKLLSGGNNNNSL